MRKAVWSAAVLSSLVASTAWSQSRAATALADADSVEQAVEQISARLQSQGFRIEAVIDHAAAAASVGLELPPTNVVFFGGDRTDAWLMRRSATLALDLPLRFLVYEDAAGDIRVERNDVGFLVDRHEPSLGSLPWVFLDSVLDQFGDAPDGVSTVASERSVTETLEALRTELAARAFRIPLVVDYGERLGLARAAVLVMFGNPNVGTPLMQSERRIALDLPQKMLIFEDRRGRVRLAYNDPLFLAKKHGVRDQDQRLQNIASALQMIAMASAGAPPSP